MEMNKSFVFNAYKYHLLTREKNTRTCIAAPETYNVWGCARNMIYEGSANDLSTNLYTLSTVYSYYNLGNIGNLYTQTVDADYLTPDISIQKIRDIPASAYIFNRNTDLTDCYIRNDNSFPIGPDGTTKGYNYDIYNLQNNSWDLLATLPPIHFLESDARKQKEFMNEQTDKYFQATYMFSSGYDPAEYHLYNIPETFVNEEIVELKASSGIFSGKLASCAIGGLLVTHTEVSAFEKAGRESFNDIQGNLQKYSADATIKTLTKNTVPVAYLNLPKSYMSNDGIVKIRWNEFGIFNLS